MVEKTVGHWLKPTEKKKLKTFKNNMFYSKEGRVFDLIYGKYVCCTGSVKWK